MIPTTPEAEVGESQIRGLPGLQSDFKTSPSNLSRPSVSKGKELGMCGSVVGSLCLKLEALDLISSTTKNRKVV